MTHRVHILLAEDSHADQVAVKRAIVDGRISCNLNIVETGKDALDYLLRRPPYDDDRRFPWPDLLLLDINMPIMTGHEVLEEIRKTAHLQTLPVIILTTSVNQDDVNKSYRLGVNAYVVKPDSIDGFVQAFIQLERFWNLVTLPPVPEMMVY